ncbi:hypothetical protein BpHYR1_001707 [Brachionus plicatilis]|uniref:Uncharacterized protein n=1 Tax=Brachionus plicatilis TaxID=10195 RepID=A0A3M7T056_BRAPC|nr:hypothetical protein BpHYR1_001707 [Brachionus plicatilis]
MFFNFFLFSKSTLNKKLLNKTSTDIFIFHLSGPQAASSLDFFKAEINSFRPIESSRSVLRLNIVDNISPNNSPFSLSVLKSLLLINGLLDKRSILFPKLTDFIFIWSFDTELIWTTKELLFSLRTSRNKCQSAFL